MSSKLTGTPWTLTDGVIKANDGNPIFHQWLTDAQRTARTNLIASVPALLDTVTKQDAIIKQCQAVLGAYLPPDGKGSAETLNALLGLLDNAGMVELNKKADELLKQLL